MKSSNFILRTLKTLTAVIVASTLSMCLASCADDGDGSYHIIDSENEQVQQRLHGTWYAEYELAGTAFNEMDSTTVDYTYVVEIYNMELNGKGYWCRYYFNDGVNPCYIKGGQKRGAYRYIAMSGCGAINLYDNTEFYESWTFSYDDETLNARGADNENHTFSKINNSLSKYLPVWDSLQN